MRATVFVKVMKRKYKLDRVRIGDVSFVFTTLILVRGGPHTKSTRSRIFAANPRDLV
ncbi:hypothetical protein KL86PLE_41146 [uncultured Pleomorphomonas sp.]|uniref:Uncharacterized protein n=1 Tax=uncultured Pleomorphomonas sp. TaxID=442121 RepID=A0A212LIG6_9HYPH|nr:hypothetical protein KL86PLE_41146 [uncultured Pleomorphomonas sp.]